MHPFVPDIPSSRESRNLAVIVYLLTIVAGFVPGLLALLLKKDDALVYDAGKESLNWSITLMLATLILGWIPLLGWALCGILWLMNAVCCVLAAINSSRGLFYRFPFALRLIA